MNKLLSFLFLLSLTTPTAAQKISVSYSNDLFPGPFTGKVILYLSKDSKTPKELTTGLPELTCFAIDVKDIKPNSSVVFDDKAISFPVKLSEIERGEYYVQAVWDRNTGGRAIGTSPGNLYNEAVKLKLGKTSERFSIVCHNIIPQPEFIETHFVKELKVNSALLTKHYGRTTSLNTAVILPKEYDTDSTRRFPVFYVILGFGGDYLIYNSGTEEPSRPLDSIPCIWVILDGNCPGGHSEYANSANNGPWGDALVNEYIPALEKKFRCNGARFVHGHSSGGWSSLWLMINYPKTFTACWSSAPDPVDFSDFGQIDLYHDKNMFYDKDSSLQIDASIGGFIPWLYLRDEYSIERVLYRGEQWETYNNCFGHRLPNGSAEKMFNPLTGEIDSTVVSHWKDYDIAATMQKRWTELRPDIDSSIRVSVGKSDNFSLNTSVQKLDTLMQSLGAHCEFRYYNGDHFTVFDNQYSDDGCHFLATRYRAWLRKHPESR